MPTRGDSALVLFPGALGDFLCFLPTLVGLRARHGGRMLVVAQAPLLELIPSLDIATASIDQREIADLFGAAARVSSQTQDLFAGFGAVYSWTGFGDGNVARHLAALAAGPVHIYPFRGMGPREHAVHYYARCAAVDPPPSIASVLADQAQWFESFARQHRLGRFVIFHPGSGSPRKNWQGFPALACQWRRRSETPLVLLRGPAEVERARGEDYGESIVVDGLTLLQVAALLRRATVYAGNDSGISHLAAAMGASGVALFGPTDPLVWAPRGPHLRILHAPEPCPRCGPDRFCLHRLPIDTVLAAIDRCVHS